MKKSKITAPILTTQRLLIRPYMDGDEILLHQAVLDSFEQLHLWMDWAVVPPTLDKTRAFIANSHKYWNEEHPNQLPFLILDVAGKNIIGTCSYNAIRWDVPSFDIGYWGNVGYTGKGLITEAANVLTRFAFSEWEAKRVEIRCDSENVKSAAIPKRLNYLLAATLKDPRVKPGVEKASSLFIFARYDAENMPHVEYSVASQN